MQVCRSSVASRKQNSCPSQKRLCPSLSFIFFELHSADSRGRLFLRGWWRSCWAGEDTCPYRGSWRSKGAALGVSFSSDDPAAAHDNVILVEHRSLAGRNCALGLVEGDEHFVGAGLLDQCRGWLMAVTNLDGDSHRLA